MGMDASNSPCGVAPAKSLIWRALSRISPVAIEVRGLAHMVLMTTGYQRHERRLRPDRTTHRT